MNIKNVNKGILFHNRYLMETAYKVKIYKESELDDPEDELDEFVDY